VDFHTLFVKQINSACFEQFVGSACGAEILTLGGQRDLGTWFELGGVGDSQDGRIHVGGAAEIQGQRSVACDVNAAIDAGVRSFQRKGGRRAARIANKDQTILFQTDVIAVSAGIGRREGRVTFQLNITQVYQVADN
ncbi:hypothetical protein, partial [Pseudomonas viridiflava]|uniref:hypothetical protein n=1 Tax=Pseudomonas viridiflava TaxID=33069 RepID=UPI0013DFF400